MVASSPKATVFIHTNDQQLIAALVSAHSLKSRSKHSDQFDVRLLRLEETQFLCKRNNAKFLWWEGNAPSVWRRSDLQSFAPLRRMVPSIMGYRGRALVIDPDVFAVGDVWELLSRDMQGRAILCRQKTESRNGRRLYSSAVMLLDCERLAHWDWERDIEDIFALRLAMGPWLSLLDEAPERIGLFEEEWNDHDRLTDATKLLHNTQISTQPWKTGLPADYHEHAPSTLFSRRGLKRFARRMLSKDGSNRVFYQPHPDRRQEDYFFALLRECMDRGSITQGQLRIAIRKNHVRKDAFEVLRRSAENAGRLGNRTAPSP